MRLWIKALTGVRQAPTLLQGGNGKGYENHQVIQDKAK
jgi:hypothetical protein